MLAAQWRSSLLGVRQALQDGGRGCRAPKAAPSTTAAITISPYRRTLASAASPCACATRRTKKLQSTSLLPHTPSTTRRPRTTRSDEEGSISESALADPAHNEQSAHVEDNVINDNVPDDDVDPAAASASASAATQVRQHATSKKPHHIHQEEQTCIEFENVDQRPE